jgi:hypothetical protein
MVRLLANDQLVASWWQVNASDFTSTTYSRYANNPSYHATETRPRIGDAAVGCSRNSDLFFSSAAISPANSPNNVLELSAEAIIGIVVYAVGCTYKRFFLNFFLRMFAKNSSSFEVYCQWN